MMLPAVSPVPDPESPAPSDAADVARQEAALEDLRGIQRHTVSINSGAPIHGVSTLQPRQAQALAALKIKKPALDPQLSLL